ncbi:ferulic acid esterase (FaeA) [Planoprotostelium fungivorum]|uniref:Ferulic acid esterase (FaeA) n=1 Tax=Planoprotostelium fungivorum TaxID=1890364 RepID=A0A2P6MYE4_9EUKA|nr:ferulic acid esterase (FaeA) [Planoprotostelium fungivorum]
MKISIKEISLRKDLRTQCTPVTWLPAGALLVVVSGACNSPLPDGYVPGVTTSFQLAAGWALSQPSRNWTVHIPQDYDPTIPTPVVFSFHGATRTVVDEEDISGLSVNGLKINNTSFIAVYPQGVAGTKGTTAWMGAPYSATGVDDVSFVLQMVHRLRKDLCVDATRIYATGKSNGGGFTNYLACVPATGNLFAAFGTVSAAIYTDYSFGRYNNCSISRGIPLMDFHGTADDTILYNGGYSNNALVMSTPYFVNGWAARDGCNLSDVTVSIDNVGNVSLGVVNVTTWSLNCRDNTSVIHFKIGGMDHAWPRTTLPAKCKGVAGNNDCDPTVINANDYLLPFFTRYNLPYVPQDTIVDSSTTTTSSLMSPTSSTSSTTIVAGSATIVTNYASTFTSSTRVITVTSSSSATKLLLSGITIFMLFAL